MLAAMPVVSRTRDAVLQNVVAAAGTMAWGGAVGPPIAPVEQRSVGVDHDHVMARCRRKAARGITRGQGEEVGARLVGGGEAAVIGGTVQRRAGEAAVLEKIAARRAVAIRERRAIPMVERRMLLLMANLLARVPQHALRQRTRRKRLR